MLQELYYCLERKIVTCLPHKAAHSRVHGGGKVWGREEARGEGGGWEGGRGDDGKKGEGQTQHNVQLYY